MATPLTAIGRYAGVLMAVMCALLIFAFVIGDPLMQYGGASAGVSNGGDLVASWDGGQINERQLDQAVVHRNVLFQFQRQVIIAGQQAAQEDGVDLQFATPRMRPIGLPRSREERVEQDVVGRKIFAKKAQEAGMVVTDEMIVDYLRAIGYDRVTNEQMREMLSRMNTGTGRRATIGFVFDLLREAMLANNYLLSYEYAFRTILPEERWEDWKRLNERVVVEAAPLKTADFVDQVPEPTDEQVQDFYDAYKNRVPSPEQVSGVELPSRLPAFSVPTRLKLSVLKADYSVAVEAAMETITDEQIAAYYEENKESFQAADTGLFGDDSLFGPSDLLSDDEDEQPTEPESEETTADETTEVAEETSETATEETSEADDADSTEEPNAEGTSAGEETAAAEEEEEEEEDQDASDADQPESESTDVTYQPLEEVSDEIRRTLASQQVVESLRQKMDRVRTKLQDAYFPYFDAKLDASAEGDSAEPIEPPAELTNLQPVAEAEQLELTEFDLVRQLDLRETPLGQAGVRAAGGLVQYWFAAFRDGEIDTYEPKLVFASDGSVYLALITDRYDAETPELDEIRDRVVAEWKRLEAAKLALAAAEALAEEAASADQSLADFLAGKEEAPVSADAVEKTDPFALLTIGQVAPTSRQIPLRLSQPEPLLAPGPELLQGVFDLSAGEVGAQLNHDHSIAYVLKIAQKIGTEDELRREFLRDGDRWLGSQTFNQARISEKTQALVQTLLTESGLEWEREADAVR